MIFYFSGTGNSKYVASKLAETQNQRLIAIADCFRNYDFSFKLATDEHVGFVMPVYFYGVPTIVLDFIAKLSLENYNRNYMFCVFTMGGSAGNATRMFSHALRGRSFMLDASFSVTMPDNYILLFDLMTPDEKQSGVLAAAELQLAGVSDSITRKDHVFRAVHSRFPRLETFSLYPLYKYGRSTKPFFATDLCNGCGLCAKICPCQIISMSDKRPVWSRGKCTQCLACVHRCPQMAIQHGKNTKNRGRYINPNAFK